MVATLWVQRVIAGSQPDSKRLIWRMELVSQSWHHGPYVCTLKRWLKMVTVVGFRTYNTSLEMLRIELVPQYPNPNKQTSGHRRYSVSFLRHALLSNVES